MLAELGLVVAMAFGGGTNDKRVTMNDVLLADDGTISVAGQVVGTSVGDEAPELTMVGCCGDFCNCSKCS